MYNRDIQGGRHPDALSTCTFKSPIFCFYIQYLNFIIYVVNKVTLFSPRFKVMRVGIIEDIHI